MYFYSWSRQHYCVNTKEKEKEKKCVPDKKKRRKRKREKSKNKKSCQDQGISCLNIKGLCRIKGIHVNLSFECK